MFTPEFCQTFTIEFNLAVQEFTKQLMKATASLQLVSHAVRKTMAKRYRADHPHKRVPGSTRTKRLRKKRDKALQEYWALRENKGVYYGTDVRKRT